LTKFHADSESIVREAKEIWEIVRNRKSEVVVPEVVIKPIEKFESM
jgi:predicted nucleic acid-binding protein